MTGQSAEFIVGIATLQIFQIEGHAEQWEQMREFIINMGKTNVLIFAYVWEVDWVVTHMHLFTMQTHWFEWNDAPWLSIISMTQARAHIYLYNQQK